MRSIKYEGASLVELLIATALSMWLIGGVLLCYLSNQRTSQVEQALAHMQENGRVAIQLLSQDIRAAGYAGCLPLDSLDLNQFSLVNNTINYIKADRIVGWHQLKSTSNYPLPNEIARNAISGSDILFIQSMLPDNDKIETAQNHLITFLNKPSYEKGDVLLIADCTHANIVEATAVKGKQITVFPALVQPYDNDSQIGYLSSVFYYIRKTTRKNAIGNPIYALYRRDINKSATNAQEIVEGVEKIYITLGVMRDNKIVHLPIDELTVSDWSQIVSVQIALLLNSIEPVSNQFTQYSFAQKIHSSTDRLLRQEWVATIALREPIMSDY